MRIDDLKLVNFRNYDHLEVSFHPKLNLIYGKNGSGKTNLVEAIYVLALTRSFRYVGDKTLISSTSSMCKVEGTVVRKFSSKYCVLLSKNGKKVRINNNSVGKISDYISKIPIVLFHPDDLRFIKDAPSTRRKTLNISISLLNVEYLRYLNHYNIILKQRNSYLKQMAVNGSLSSNYLDILTEKLVDYGIFLYQNRRDFISKVSIYLSSIYARITSFEGLEIKYLSHYQDLSRNDIIELYKGNFQKDLRLTKTSIGIHMDDLKFILNGKDLREYGSEGQQKNAIISYKFSELEIFKEITDSYPIFILDDLFSELDNEKVQNILNLLNSEIQTFITTTDLERFESLENFYYKSFCILNGKIVEESEHERRK